MPGQPDLESLRPGAGIKRGRDAGDQRVPFTSREGCPGDPAARVPAGGDRSRTRIGRDAHASGISKTDKRRAAGFSLSPPGHAAKADQPDRGRAQPVGGGAGGTNYCDPCGNRGKIRKSLRRVRAVGQTHFYSKKRTQCKPGRYGGEDFAERGFLEVVSF